MLTVTLCFFSYPEYIHNITGLPYPEPGQPAVYIPEPDKTLPPPFSPAAHAWKWPLHLPWKQNSFRRACGAIKSGKPTCRLSDSLRCNIGRSFMRLSGGLLCVITPHKRRHILLHNSQAPEYIPY